MLKNATKFIVNEKGTEVIREHNQKDYKREEVAEKVPEAFTDLSFEDI